MPFVQHERLGLERMDSRGIASAGRELTRDHWLRLWFYLGVPLLTAFFLGWSQVGRTSDWSKGLSMLYWFGVTFGSLFFLETLTTPFAAFLRPRGVPLWLTLLLAQLLIGWVALVPVMRVWTAWVQNYVPAGLASPLQSFEISAMYQKLPTNIILWVGINLLFFRVFGMDRFGYPSPERQLRTAPAQDPLPLARDQQGGYATPAVTSDGPVARSSPAAGTAARHPAFFARLAPDRRGRLLAVHSEGHYLQVYTDAGSEMIYYRLRDALTELQPEDGMQVHRSWWVSSSAIEGSAGDTLRLRNGLTVPVSRSFRVQARERGWL